MEGDGVPANASKATRFLLKAAEAGHKQSQYQVRNSLRFS
jgi:TPR repeat protein